MTVRKLTDKQEAFLDALFTPTEQGGAGGDAHQAKILAGYSPDTATRLITDALKEEISSGVMDLFVSNAPSAAFEILAAMKTPSTPGVKIKMSAASNILDRGGFNKTEKLEIDASGGVFILPEKG